MFGFSALSILGLMALVIPHVPAFEKFTCWLKPANRWSTTRKSGCATIRRTKQDRRGNRSPAISIVSERRMYRRWNTINSDVIRFILVDLIGQARGVH